MNYDGAIAAFENALLSNPKSASAHLELGLLYEEKKANYAAAIYHYQKHLELRPESNMAETVKQHVFSCRLEMAKTVSFLLVSRQVQDEMRRLTATNALLHDQISLLKTQLVDQAAVYNNKLASLIPGLLPRRPESEFRSRLQRTRTGRPPLNGLPPPGPPTPPSALRHPKNARR